MKLMFTLAKSAKLNWGLNRKALKTIYLGDILPLLLYGAPVWVKAMTLKSYKDKIIRVQRIINIKIAKAYRTVSNEAVCVLTGLTPIALKIEEIANLNELTKGSSNKNVIVDSDMEVNPSAWGHLNPSSYCDVGRLFYGVFKLWSKLQRKK